MVSLPEYFITGGGIVFLIRELCLCLFQLVKILFIHLDNLMTGVCENLVLGYSFSLATPTPT